MRRAPVAAHTDAVESPQDHEHGVVRCKRSERRDDGEIKDACDQRRRRPKRSANEPSSSAPTGRIANVIVMVQTMSPLSTWKFLARTSTRRRGRKSRTHPGSIPVFRKRLRTPNAAIRILRWSRCRSHRSLPGLIHPFICGVSLSARKVQQICGCQLPCRTQRCSSPQLWRESRLESRQREPAVQTRTAPVA